jgi:glycerophosphoryl diester phosphodiesterase
MKDENYRISSDRQKQIMVYGGDRPVSIIRDRLPLVQTLSIHRLKQCLVQYAALGWIGYIPANCKRSMLMIPINYAPWLWGWPNRFLQRMMAANTDIFLLGDYAKDFLRDLMILKVFEGSLATIQEVFGRIELIW